MASGVPVVASPNVGAKEVLQEGASGLLSADADLGTTIIRLLTDESLRMTLRDAGLKRSLDFSWDRVCSLYEALYAPLAPGAAQACAV